MKYNELAKKKGIEHVNEVCTKEMQRIPIPNCDLTIGEACYDDFTSGYMQAIRDLKVSEMLDMLIKLRGELTAHTPEKIHDQLEQLIKEATEL